MTRYGPIALFVLCLFLAACGNPDGDAAFRDAKHHDTDTIMRLVRSNAESLRTVAVIDHARLAAAEGVTMPASQVLIASDPTVNTAILKTTPRAGIDLPVKVLAYAPDGRAAVATVTSGFLAARHGAGDERALEAFDAAVDRTIQGVDAGLLTRVDGTGVTRDQGIITLTSAYAFDETVERLSKVVRAQGDTVWFGEIDYTAEAASQGVTLPPATLLLFGGPKPGGVAMADFPRLGLDAFCQKLLVLQEGDTVLVLFNSIVALAELHYGRVAKPHAQLDTRLTKTFQGAIAADGK